MTNQNIDIEQQRREFEVWLDQGHRSGCNESMFKAYLAAKRAATGSAEPVGYVTVGVNDHGPFSFEPTPHGTDSLADGQHAVYTAPPAPVSAEPDWSSSKTLLSEMWKNPSIPMPERLQIADGAVRFRDEVIANLRQQIAIVPSLEIAKNDEIESAAQAIYEEWRSKNGYVEWVPNGNSLKQDEARQFARQSIAAKIVSPSASVSAEPVTALQVWYGPMPESNGKSNFTAILHRGDIAEGYTIDRSEFPERVRYEADRMRYLIGEIDANPFILDYDADKHSGYVAPPSADAKDAARAARNYITTSGTLDYVFQQVMASRSPDEQFNLLGGLVDAAIAVALKQVTAAQQPQAAASVSGRSAQNCAGVSPSPSSLIGHNDDLPAGWTRAPDGRVSPPPGMTSEAYCASSYAPPSAGALEADAAAADYQGSATDEQSDSYHRGYMRGRRDAANAMRIAKGAK